MEKSRQLLRNVNLNWKSKLRSFNDNKSHQVSRTLLSILTGHNNTGVWILSIIISIIIINLEIKNEYYERKCNFLDINSTRDRKIDRWVNWLGLVLHEIKQNVRISNVNYNGNQAFVREENLHHVILSNLFSCLIIQNSVNIYSFFFPKTFQLIEYTFKVLIGT